MFKPVLPVFFQRPSRFCLFLFYIALLAAFSTMTGTPLIYANSGPVIILAAGDLRGEIKPCGCSPEGQMGGLLRRLTYLEKIRKGKENQTLLVDLGNNFPPPSPQGTLKVELIQNMLELAAPQAILPGPNELVLGKDTLKKGLPYLVSNDEIGKLFLPHRMVEKNGRKIAIFGYLSPTQIYQKSQKHFRLLPLSEPLLSGWRAALSKIGNPRAILLFRGEDRELKKIQQSGIFRAIIAGNPFEDEQKQITERSIGKIKIPQVPTKGQGLIRLRLGPQGAAARAQVDWLTGNYADHPAALAAFKTYDEQVKALFFSRMKIMAQQQTESPFLGAESCRKCHPAQLAIWEKSRHATAIQTLERVGKSFDPECLACHVVGLEAGGFISKDLTPHLTGVQCENCHGAARAHLADPAKKPAPFSPPFLLAGKEYSGAGNAGGKTARQMASNRKPGEATCKTCHMGSHSPKFKFDIYWPKIKH